MASLSMLCTNLRQLCTFIVHEDGDEMLDIHITATLDKMLVKEIEHAIALAAINEKEQELENAANSFDWSVGHVCPLLRLSCGSQTSVLKKMLELDKEKNGAIV